MPALKEQVADQLTASGKRFLFIVDDIDRLAPEEIQAIFKVVNELDLAIGAVGRRGAAGGAS